ncbi:MAG: hypothetical protein ACRED8_06815 [Caulobacteraceae bacterium]
MADDFWFPLDRLAPRKIEHVNPGKIFAWPSRRAETGVALALKLDFPNVTYVLPLNGWSRHPAGRVVDLSSAPAIAWVLSADIDVETDLRSQRVGGPGGAERALDLTLTNEGPVVWVESCRPGAAAELLPFDARTWKFVDAYSNERHEVLRFGALRLRCKIVGRDDPVLLPMGRHQA